MPNYDPQQIALFRYQVIAPLVSLAGPRGTLRREMQRIAARSHDHPYRGPTRYGLGTIEEWHYLYKRDGLDGLLPAVRRDRGRSRVIDQQTVRALRPRLLLLDPLVRLHRVNENDAVEMAQVLSGLRELQKRFQVAVVVVHHARKNGAASAQPGQGLRGSSDLWAWSDSNLYLRRHQRQLVLSMEHRAAAAPQPIALRLADADADRLHLEVVDKDRRRPSGKSLDQEILDVLREVPSMNRLQLRARLQVKNEPLGRALQRLQKVGQVDRGSDGCRLATAREA